MEKGNVSKGSRHVHIPKTILTAGVNFFLAVNVK